MESHMYEEMAALEESHWWFKGRRAVVFDVLRRFVPKGGRVLDVGLGTGFNAHLVQTEGYEVEGVEPADDAIAYAKKKAPAVTVIKSGFPSAEIVSEKYDAVLLLDVLEHLEDDARALADVHRILKPGGVVLITVPAFMFLWTEHDTKAHHFRRYTRPQLRKKLADADLSPAVMSYYNFFLFIPICIVRGVTRLLRRAETSDFDKTPAFLNQVFSAIFGSERVLLRFMNLPFGVSVIVCAQKDR